MLINKSKIKIGFLELANVLVSMFFLIGINCWFNACGPKSDGTYMTCHYAGQMIVALSAVIFALSVLHVLVPDLKVKIGMDLALIPLCAVTAAVPGQLIKLCAMDSMMCNTHTKPATLAFSLVLLFLALIDMVLLISALKKDAKKAKLKEKIEGLNK